MEKLIEGNILSRCSFRGSPCRCEIEDTNGWRGFPDTVSIVWFRKWLPPPAEKYPCCCVLPLVAQALYQNGAANEVDYETSTHRTALIEASELGVVDLITDLVKCVASPFQTSYHTRETYSKNFNNERKSEHQRTTKAHQ